jgi:hypothetical protein
MIYNIAVIFILSYFDTYEHVDHPFYIHLNIYDIMLHVINMQLLFFGIKLGRKLSKFLTLLPYLLELHDRLPLDNNATLPHICYSLIKNKIKTIYLDPRSFVLKFHISYSSVA